MEKLRMVKQIGIMKAIFQAIISLSVLTGLVGCAKELEINQEHPSTDENPMVVTLTANQEGSDTRAEIGYSDSYTAGIDWSEGDAITVFDGASANIKFTLADGDGTSKGVFQGKVTKLAESYTALYPYQENVSMDADGILKGVVLKNKQKAVAGSFDPEAALMMAKTEAGSKALQFYNIVGFIAVTPEFDCEKITLLSDYHQATLAGTADISINNGKPVVESISGSGFDRVSIEGDIKANNTYYIAALPGAMYSFKLIFTDKDGNDTFKESDPSKNSLYIERSNIVNLGSIASDLPEFIPYVSFKSSAGKQKFSMKLVDGIGPFEYSVNNGEWKTVQSEEKVAFGGDLGDLRLRGVSGCGTAIDNTHYSKVSFHDNVISYGSYDVQLSVECMGDIRTLIDWKNYKKVDTKNASFAHLFYGTTLMSAPDLPATELAPSCYYNMFACSSLEAAPELPATTLTPNCYEEMFKGCSILTTAVIWGESLAKDCYKNMFSNCNRISDIRFMSHKDYPSSVEDYGANWLENTYRSATIHKRSGVVLPEGWIPSGWTVSEDVVD